MSGGTNSKIKNQNKAIKKQYNYDRKYHDYTEKLNEKRYEKAVTDTELQQGNYDAVRRYKNKVAAQQYEYQQELQDRQFTLDKQVYRQALDDYDNQTEMNSKFAALADESELRKQQEALISRQYGFETEEINNQSAKFDLRDSRLGLREAKADSAFDLRDMRSNLRYAQQTAGLDKDALASDRKFASESRTIGMAENLATLRAAEATNTTDIAALTSKEAFSRKDAGLDQQEIAEQKSFTSASSRERVAKLDTQKEKLNEDVKYLDNANVIDLKSINLAYNKKQTANFNKRIDALIKREQDEGKARAGGREGLSADRARTDALSAYGRSQAQLVESLVFASDERTYELGKTNLTKDYQKTLKTKDKDILKGDRNIELLSRDRELGKLNISSSKINAALEQTVAQIGFDKQRANTALTKAKSDYTTGNARLDKEYEKAQREYNIGTARVDRKLQKATRDFKTSDERRDSKIKFIDKRLKLNTERSELQRKRNNLNYRQIDSTFESAIAQSEADRSKIKMDETAANMAAHGKIPQRPMLPVELPMPYKTPKTILPMPQAPFKSPKPVRGALGKTSIWNDVGDAANIGLSIAGLFI